MEQARRLLPVIHGREDYAAQQQQSAPWLAAMRAIARRHGLAAERLVRISEGTNVVFADAEVVVKLYPPFWAELARTERVIAGQVFGRLGVATPALLAHGDLEGWPYLIMTRLDGTPLSGVWDTLLPDNRLAIAADLGAVLARLHALPTAGLPRLSPNWPTVVREGMAGCVARQRSQGAAERWLEQIPAFLAGAMPLYPIDFTPVILSGDLHQYHLLVSQADAQWRLQGLFDFDDARIGFSEYDFASPGLFMMAGQPELLRTFLRAYGYPAAAVDQALSARLLAYTLLNRYRPLRWILEEIGAAARSATLEELADAIYGLGEAAPLGHASEPAC